MARGYNRGEGKNLHHKAGEKSTLKNGNPINVAAQFGQPNGNPRHNGAWKKEDTARYKLEQMMKMTEAELQTVIKDEDAPQFERKLATCIDKGQWKEMREMMDEVYGIPKQAMEIQTMEMPLPLSPAKRKKAMTKKEGAKE